MPSSAHYSCNCLLINNSFLCVIIIKLHELIYEGYNTYVAGEGYQIISKHLAIIFRFILEGAVQNIILKSSLLRGLSPVNLLVVITLVLELSGNLKNSMFAYKHLCHWEVENHIYRLAETRKYKNNQGPFTVVFWLVSFSCEINYDRVVNLILIGCSILMALCDI